MSDLAQRWTDAVAQVRVRHIDPTCEPVIQVTGAGEPSLYIGVRHARDTLDQDRRIGQLGVSTVRLTYWPGSVVAQAWLAAGWAGYITHEALELVDVAGIRCLDPHREPIEFDRGLRKGLPPILTPATLLETLELVMSPGIARQFVAQGGSL